MARNFLTGPDITQKILIGSRIPIVGQDDDIRICRIVPRLAVVLHTGSKLSIKLNVKIRDENMEHDKTQGCLNYIYSLTTLVLPFSAALMKAE